MSKLDVKVLSKLVDEGLSLIPAIIDEEGKKKAAIKKWGGSNPVLTINQLIDEIGKKGVEYIAIVTGKQSGGLICIDVDTKHKLGFDAIILNDLKELYPELLDKFRIEKTPSGGLHIIYRVNLEGSGSSEYPSSSDLASRMSTEEELAIRADRKKFCFLEIKAEGGLIHSYPSEGYSRLKDGVRKVFRFDDFLEQEVEVGRVEGVQTLSWGEHCSLMSLCRLYDTTIKNEYIKPTRQNNDYYVEGMNPYEDFDQSPEGENVLQENGWKFSKRSGKFDWYQKPDAKGKAIGATFNVETKLYKIWTTGTDILPKSYSPSNLKAFLEFGDKKGGDEGLYKHLVALGYGKIKPAIEKNIAKNKAKFGGELPANISESAKLIFESEKKKIGETYPYGVFWEEREEGGYKISRDKFLKTMNEVGFVIHKDNPCYISGYVIKQVSERFVFNKMKSYLLGYGDGTIYGNIGELKSGKLGLEDSSGVDVDTEIIDCYEAFLQSSGKFSINRLDLLDTTRILKSEKLVSYKFYKNCYVKISKNLIECVEYSEITGLIWETDIKDRDFKIIENYKQGLYYEFIKNAIDFEGKNSEYIKKCIGYYAHDHRDEEGYMVIATESCENPSDGGGSGKNIFWDLFSLITTYKPLVASMISFSNNLLQAWDYQRIVAIHDIPKKKNDGKDFDLIFFKDIITGSATVNKKYINEFSIEISEMPKICGSSNYSFDDADPGIRRRVRALEFTDYYTIRHGVKEATGKMFPKDWDSIDYTIFDNIMLNCIQVYLKSNNAIERKEMSSGGWAKQFQQNFNHLYEFIKVNIEDWVRLGRVKTGEFNRQYTEFRTENNINRGLSAYSINRALVEYCKHYRIDFAASEKIQWKENGVKFSGRYFGNEAKKFNEKHEVVEDEKENVTIEDEAPF